MHKQAVITLALTGALGIGGSGVAQAQEASLVGQRVPVKEDVEQLLINERPNAEFVGSLSAGQTFKVRRLSPSGKYAYGFAYGGANKTGWVLTSGLRAVRTGSAANWPPANSGCGENGPTMSSDRPTVELASDALGLRDTGRVRVSLRGNQTAATAVTIAQIGGRRVGGTASGTYTCITPAAGVVSLPLNDYGRRLVRRHGELKVTLAFRLVNGSGVTNTVRRVGVVRPVR